MTVAEALQQFYTDNNFDKDGGESKNTFELKFQFFTLKLPNSQFRKDVIHIHDIQHVLYNCDTTWKGEAFIAGWEIATGFWKHLPVGFFSLWAMGFSLLIHPKEVVKGYNAGLKCNGVVDIDISKEAILKLPLEDVKKLIHKDNPPKFNWFSFLFWSLISEIVFLFPLIVILIIILYFN